MLFKHGGDFTNKESVNYGAYNRADAHYSYSYRKYYRYDRYKYYGESSGDSKRR